MIATAALLVAAALPSAQPGPQRSKDTRALPPVVATYATLWLQQLHQLAAASGADIGAPAFGVSP